ncbi:MAG: toxin-antitoxin system HicB family antitoxin [Chloroherpetonaceae bacterium]|nr:toxin-antitoxin system HicB family antitoxin [Chloroherpetonaceae bacterium]
MNKSLNYYLGLNYPIEISRLTQEDGGGFYACIPQLGRYAFQGDGATIEEALQELEVSKKMLFEEFLEKGIPIPEPRNEDEEKYSGKFILRLPKTLHRSLAQRAQEEGTSLNQFVVSLLSSSAAVSGFETATKAIVKNFQKILEKDLQTSNKKGERSLSRKGRFRENSRVLNTKKEIHSQ